MDFKWLLILLLILGGLLVYFKDEIPSMSSSNVDKDLDALESKSERATVKEPSTEHSEIEK